MRTIIATICLLVSIPLFATPTGLVTIPSTDIQATGVLHLGMDSFAYLDGDATAPFVDLNLTYGITPRIEAGIDLVSPADNPVWYNAKVLLLTPDQSPVPVAVGIYNGATEGALKQDVFYAVGSYAIPEIARVTFGGYKANEDTFGDDDTGFMLGVDKTVGKYWYGADYFSGENPLGSWNVGVGYAITDTVGVILGYDNYNTEGVPDSLNFQFDWNL